MDTGKLLKVIEDVQKDESGFAFQAKFQKILDLYPTNNPDALNTEKDALQKGLSQARLSNYVLTDFKILEGLTMDTLFGDRSWVELNNILNNQAHEVAKKLTDFVTQRQAALTKLGAIKSTLNAVNINARELKEKEYEIGFSFPEEYQKLTNFEEVLKDVQLFLVAVASATGENKDFRINYVSNGTIEIFIHASQQLAQYFSTALEYALKVYETVQMAGALKKGYENFTQDKKDTMDKITDADKEEKSKAFIEELMSQLKIETPDDKNRVTILFGKILKHFESGVSAEVKTPIISKPDEPLETDDETTRNKIAELKQQYEINKVIDSRNKRIFKLQQTKIEGLSAGFLLGDNDQSNNKINS
jgi:hypothetical protein